MSCSKYHEAGFERRRRAGGLGVESGSRTLSILQSIETKYLVIRDRIPPSPHMKLLGIDYGKKKIGIAVSDSDGRMAFPKEVIKNDTHAIHYIANLVKQEGAGAVIVGESTDYKGEENPIMEDIKRFNKTINEKTNVPVYLEPETLSTKEAEHIQERHDKIDASAAAIILQSYIDRV